MAASHEDQSEDLLVCTICLETFKVPKYLPCLHTFCELCIGTYINSNVSKENDKCGFACPVCLKFVEMDDTKENCKFWAERLPQNRLIVSILDAKAIAKSEKLCNVCEISNLKQKAVSWCTFCEEAFCSSCENCHRKFKISSSHKVISLKEMQTELSTTLFSGNVSCDDHPDKFIEIYCVDHSKPCCTVCATVNHRKCDRVITVEEAFSGVKESKQTLELLKQLKQLSGCLDDSIEKAKKNSSEVQSEVKQISTEIEILKANFMKHLAKIEQLSKDELNFKAKTTLIQLTDKLTELSSFKATIDNWLKTMQACLAHGSELQCLVQVNRLNSRIVALDDEIRKCTSTFRIENMKFKEHKFLQDFQNNVEFLGEIFINDIAEQTNSMRTGKISLLHMIDTGKSGNYATSGIFIGGQTILADGWISKIFKYTKQGVYQQDLKLPFSPYDVCEINRDEIAVSSSYGDIGIVNITEMKVKNVLKLTIRTSGIQYFKNEFILVYNEMVTWVDFTSRKTVRQQKTKGCTYYIHVNKNEYIFADGSNAVMSRTCDGGEKFRYTNDKLFNPRGVDTDFQGNIYVCSLSTNNVHQLTPEGKLVRIIPTDPLGIDKPLVLGFEPNSNKFLLTSAATGKVAIAEIV